jgi:hypothetical protein
MLIGLGVNDFHVRAVYLTSLDMTTRSARSDHPTFRQNAWASWFF